MADRQQGKGAAGTAESRDIGERIVKRIRDGLYAPGQRLVEADLMRDFGVGRSRLRDTLRTLVGEGYLTVEENRGVLVRRLTRREAINMGRVREVVEGLAARQAAERPVDPATREELTALLAAMDRAAEREDLPGFGETNARFHALIFQQAANDELALLVRRLSVPMFRLQFGSAFTVNRLSNRNEHHRNIARAILDGDPEAAEAAMRVHIRCGNETLHHLDDEVFAAD